MKSKNKTNSNSALIIILVICAIMLFFHCINVPAGRISSYGEWGNFIGGVFGTVIAGFACYYVYQTYISQKKELEKTNETSEKQQFESTFFNLVRCHAEALNSVSCVTFNLARPLPDSPENISLREELEQKWEERKLTTEEYALYYDEEAVYGKSALYVAFTRGVIKEEQKIEYSELAEYYYSPWFKSILLTLMYLGDNKDNDGKKDNKRFYTEFFCAQITRPEWWFLYGIYLYVEEKTSNNEKDTYEELVKEMDIFDYGYSYISEKYHVTHANIYDKTKKHEMI